MSNDAHAWDRLGEGIRSSLPEWARYEGYGTYGVAGYAYAYMFAVLAGLFYTWGNTAATVLSASIALFAWLLGSYYKGAAKVRLTCDHCDAHARGESFCPECGEMTYTGGNE